MRRSEAHSRVAIGAMVILGGMIMLMLSGCASQVVSIRTVPDQTPAADTAAAVASAAAFAEAAAAESQPVFDGG